MAPSTQKKLVEMRAKAMPNKVRMLGAEGVEELEFHGAN
ncbi:hypothetical protein PC128_g13010 [Phytophthora cactorum]|nr:hypothetical protein PC128_g13010 [Phytophthora cactorum]